MKKKTVYGLLCLLSLALIGVGGGMIYLPAGLIAVGLLLWIDLSWGSRKK